MFDLQHYKKLVIQEPDTVVSELESFNGEGLSASEAAEKGSILGMAYHRIGQSGKALSAVLNAVQIAKENNLKEELAQYTGSAGLAAMALGDLEQALDLFEVSLKEAKKIGDDSLTARAKGHLGMVYYSKKDYEPALAFTRQAVETFRTIGSKEALSRFLNNLAIYLWETEGPTDECVAVMKEVVELKKTEPDLYSRSLSLCNLSGICRERGEFTVAWEALEEADSLRAQMNLNEPLSFYHLNLAAWLTAPTNPQRDLDEGLIVLEECLKSCRETTNLDFELKVLEQKHKALASLARWEEAYQTSLTASDIARKQADEGQRQRLANLRVSLEVENVNENLAREKQQREQLQKLLEINEEQKNEIEAGIKINDELLAIVSHDIRGPIGNIGLMSELALQNDIDSREALELIRDGSFSIQQTLENLLALRYFSGEGAQLSAEEIDLKSFWTELSNYWIRVARPKEVIISGNIEENLLVKESPVFLRHLLGNLISNAIKYSPPGSPVEILGYKSGDKSLGIKVLDRGEGIPQEKHHLLFQQFGMVGSVPTAGESSSGLGLFICKHLAERLGGGIRYENRQDGGAEFTVSLPCY